MPMLSDLRNRFSKTVDAMLDTVVDGETLVTDSRHGMKSTQILEEKFGAALLRQSSESSLRVEGRRTPFSIVIGKPR
jgi:hypothetical protein